MKDTAKKFKIGDYTIEFVEGKWRIINYLGCGIYSDNSLLKCKKIAKTL